MSSWPLVRLGDVCDKITDGTHHSPANHASGDFKYITAKNIKPWGLDLSDITYIDAQTHREIYSRCDVKKDDILYVKDGVNTGRVAVNPLEEEFSLLSSVAVLRASPAIRPKYLAYALQESQTLDRMLADMAGVAITRLTLRKLNDAEIPLAPLGCQDRIVEKLEELLSDLDAGVAELKAAQHKLAQYRQSLLKAAVEGALTADWRAARASSNQPQETGADLLQRILTERRARWEAKQLAKFAEQGKTPPRGWQAKYPEPIGPSTANLEKLPAGWSWATLDQVVAESLIGLDRGHDHQSRISGNAGYVKMNNVSMDGDVDTSAIVRIETSKEEIVRYSLVSGDLLFNTRNSRELVGKTGIVREADKATVYNNNLMRLRFDGAVTSEFLCSQMCAPEFRRRMERVKKATTSVAAIYAKDLFPLPVAMPPMDEQIAIGDMLATYLKAIDEQSAAVSKGLNQAAAQRKNILKAAFAGQLVPQDPNDEPASVLLERIRAERAAPGASGKKRGRTPRTSA